ncbi:MAG: glycogen debranching protein, partial [Eudoraea sp.]|nr:glycogen debranching protein [Eudoraea sp.]NNK30195.1 glycogen debranching protein [Flavobacteriaceae bacterium]
LMSCGQKQVPVTLGKLLEGAPSIAGKKAYLESPYVTAGDRLYMVGHQDGSFPEIGWHVTGEMGGIWDHPIKLMDGFDMKITAKGQEVSLNKATTFINYPFANEHRFLVPTMNLEVVRRQFVPDGKEGIIVEYTLHNTSDIDKSIDLTFTGHADLRPVWLGERSGMNNAQDTAEFDAQLGSWFVKDQENPWFLIFGSDLPPQRNEELKSPYKGMGVSGSLSYTVSIPAGSNTGVTFAIAGSYTDKQAALATFTDLRENKLSLLEEKKNRYAVLAASSKLTVPDPRLEEAFEWLKYNCDWLIRSVPEIGTGITAGIPDYPWWFGVDSEYALKGYMAIGQNDIVHQTIKLLDSVSNAVNGNGKIIHEMSTNGSVFNPGNINETPQFASLIWESFLWNGDKEFLRKYFPTIKKGLAWLMEANDSNQNLFPDGFGMMEIHGLDSEMIDVAAYTQRAFDDAAKMARILEDEGLAAEYQSLAERLKEKINREFWSEEFNSFADFIGTDEQALHLIDDAIVRADTLNKPWAVVELKQTAQKIRRNPSTLARPFVLHHNWVVNTPMEMQIAETDKALKALKTAEKFVNPFGVFVTGIDRDESAGSNDGSFQGSKVFSYTGAVMTLPTGVQAVAENNYGRPDKALNYLNRMTRTFSYALPGSMYEVSPDYGMITQAWNIYAFAIPIVQQFFGILPNAAEKKIVIRPQMPTSWDIAKLENVKVADNSVSVSYEKSASMTQISILQLIPGWSLELQVQGGQNVRFKTSGKGVRQVEENGFMVFTTEEKELILEIYQN